MSKLWRKKPYRGSLFTNQELAIAYYSKFDKVILLQEEGVLLEGFLKYIQGINNKLSFRDKNNAAHIVHLIENEINKRKWTNSYRRNLSVNAQIRSDGPMVYKDHAGVYNQYVWFIEIINNNSEYPARGGVATLWDFKFNNNSIHQPDKAPLKWTGMSTHDNGIVFLGKNCEFDAFALDFNNPSQIYLHSLLDLSPRPSLNTFMNIQNLIGISELEYRVYFNNFQPLFIKKELNLTGNCSTTRVTLKEFGVL